MAVINSTFAQEHARDPEGNQVSSFHIQWTGQFPGSAGDRENSFLEQVSELVFGRKEYPVIKPFSVIATDPSLFWILDQGSGTVFEIREGKENRLKPAGDREKNLPSLVGICRAPSGDVLFTDSRLNHIYRSSGGRYSLLFDTLDLARPTGIGYSMIRKEIWVVETAAHRVTILSEDGVIKKRLGERGTGPGQFNFPTFLWIDHLGNVYIVDSMNFRIQLFDQNGQFVSMFGKHGDTSGSLARPKGLATDSYGNIYVADALFHVVQVFNPEGQFLTSFGRQGQDREEFWMPAGLYIDPLDNIYVADSYNSRIQVFKLVKM